MALLLIILRLDAIIVFLTEVDMKNVLIGVVSFVLLACVLFANIMPKQTAQLSNEHNTELNMLKQLEKQYGENLYLALFTLPEFRSYSIIAFDKTSELYNSNWHPANSYLSLLNYEDRTKLMEITANRIQASADSSEKVIMIRKLKKWCIAYSQIQFIAVNMSIPQSAIIQSFSELEATEEIISKFKYYQNSSTGIIDENNYEQAFAAVINHLSEQSNKEQMQYFGSLYKNLSCIAQ